MLNIEWRVIAEFPNYEVSNTGLIKNSLGKIMKTFVQNSGYEVASFSIRNGRSAKRTVHRVVAIAFIPNPDNVRYVNHIDGVKTNNPASNLEWVTAQQNIQHARDLGLAKYNKPTLGKKLAPRGAAKKVSQYHGVYWTATGVWVCGFQMNGKRYQTSSKCELTAAQLYDALVKKHNATHRPLNFPDD